MGRPLRVIQNIYPYHLVCRTNHADGVIKPLPHRRYCHRGKPPQGHVPPWRDIIETDDHYLATVRYVYQNPVRAGMVDDLEEFTDSTFQYYAFGKKVDVVLVDDHLVLRLNGNKRKIGEYFRILVLSEEIWISDWEVKKGLRRMFFGSADFIQRMHDTYCCQQ